VLDIKNIHSAYFIGIGGIGMSAIARFFNSIGIEVSGYDKTKTALTDELIREGIKIHFEDNVKLIPNIPDIVVYTPAVPKDHSELSYYRENDFTVKKRSEVLGDITSRYFTIAVAGTHGKTSISTMISHILFSSGRKITSFVGGISKNFKTNFINNTGSDVVIVEADEYDRSFLTLNPDIAVISSIDADHLDIYGTKENMEVSFRMFAGKIKNDGSLIVKNNINLENTGNHKIYKYSLKDECQYYAKNIRIIDSSFIFDLVHPNGQISNIKAGAPGNHNIENAVVAAAVCLQMKVDEKEIKKAIESYSGVCRRFDYQINTKEFVYIDDYAHHPEELKAIISAVKELYPTRKITGVFQPHLYSRTHDFADDFAKSLNLLDEVILLDIYPARELPIEGITSEWLLNKIETSNKCLVQKPDLVATLKIKKPGILLTLGAGDIDQFIEPIKKAFEN
jgi:UDP-N-acetylmuramate--alanine ligase